MKKYIKSYTADDLKAQLGDNYPKGGYLYILKHGIGPGTIPRDVTVVKTKDLPNYYTAVWLDRFLSADELREYDIPSETDINKYLGRINYCQKNGDVVPCDEVKGSTSVRGFTPAHIDDPDDEESEWYDWWNDVDGYLLEYDDNFKKIIYDFRDKYGMPKNMSDDLCDKLADVIFDYVKNNLERLGIDPNENTDQDYSEFAHERMVEWLVEPYLYGDFWDDYTENGENDVQACDQVTASMSVDTSTLEPRQRTAVDGKTWWVVFDTATGKYSTYTCFGKYKTKKDCQYAIDHCEYSHDINSATEPNAPDAKKSKLVREIIKRAKEVRDYFQSHNNNLNRRQEQILDDLSDGIDNQSISAIRDAIENLKYNSKNMRSGQYALIIDLYNDFNLAGGKFEGMGYPQTDDVDACDTITGSINADYGKDMIKFFYKHKFLGACNPEDIYCEAVYDLMKSDKNAASQILHYMNHLGDPVFPVSEEDWGTPETDVDNVDLWELYSTFMQELDYEYNDDKDMGYDFSVYPDFQPWDFEIFEGEVAEENVVTGSTKPRYMANMVSASSSDSAYDENDELYKFCVTGYLRENFSGIMEEWYTHDFEEALEHAADMSRGLYVEIENQIDGRSRRFTPEEWEEAIALGDYPNHVREDLAL